MRQIASAPFKFNAICRSAIRLAAASLLVAAFTSEGLAEQKQDLASVKTHLEELLAPVSGFGTCCEKWMIPVDYDVFSLWEDQAPGTDPGTWSEENIKYISDHLLEIAKITNLEIRYRPPERGPGALITPMGQKQLIIVGVRHWDRLDEIYRPLIRNFFPGQDPPSLLHTIPRAKDRCILLTYTEPIPAKVRAQFGKRLLIRAAIFVGWSTAEKFGEREKRCIAFQLLAAMGLGGKAKSFESMRNPIGDANYSQRTTLSELDRLALKVFYSDNFRSGISPQERAEQLAGLTDSALTMPR